MRTVEKVKSHLASAAYESLLKRASEYEERDWERADKFERHAINAVLDLKAALALNAVLLKAIEELECPDCGHALKFHADKYNCEVDRGDGYRIGSEILEALGPCGCDCSNRSDRSDCPDLLPLIAAIRKAKGE
jgi:hypothetical protein